MAQVIDLQKYRQSFHIEPLAEDPREHVTREELVEMFAEELRRERVDRLAELKRTTALRTRASLAGSE